MKCIQSILAMIKKGKLEMDSRLKYTWIWYMSSIWKWMIMACTSCMKYTKKLRSAF